MNQQDCFSTPTLQRPQKINQVPNLKKIRDLRVRDRCCGYWFHVIYVPNLQRNLSITSARYNISINNNIAEMTITQTYQNDLQSAADVEYVFQVDPQAAFSGLEVVFGEKRLIGVIKEKEEAKKEFQEKVNQGYTMVYTEKDADQEDLVRVKLGNLMPGDKLEVEMTYVQPLDVCVNKFWRLIVPTAFTPRYRNKPVAIERVPPQLKRYFNNHQFNNQIQVTINLIVQQQSPITLINSPSHNLHETERSPKNDFIVFNPLVTQPGKDFQILFATEDLHKPITTITKISEDASLHQKYCATLSFIPEFNDLPVEDAYLAYMQDNLADSDDFYFSQQRGNYIFLVDRSGSMSGNRMLKAKDALQLFIRSLPVDSYFNVVSFGSTYRFMWSESKKFSADSMNQALKEIEGFSANMNGTEILQPLQKIKDFKDIQDYPTNIFVLTDGDVSNTENVIKLGSQMKSATKRIYTLGIGDGCSRYLVEALAVQGNGKFEFVADGENLNAKVIALLQDSITPFLKDVKIELSAQQGLVSIIPDPQSLTCVRKLEPLTFHLVFDASLENSVDCKVSCWDSIVLSQRGFTTTVDPSKAIENQSFHKLAAHKQIRSLEQAYQYDFNTVNFIWVKQNPNAGDILSLSIANQVLSTQTAFICEVKPNDFSRDVLWQLVNRKAMVERQSQQVYDDESDEEFGYGAVKSRGRGAVMKRMKMAAPPNARAMAAPKMMASKSNAVNPMHEKYSLNQIAQSSVQSLAIQERSIKKKQEKKSKQRDRSLSRSLSREKEREFIEYPQKMMECEDECEDEQEYMQEEIKNIKRDEKSIPTQQTNVPLQRDFNVVLSIQDISGFFRFDKNILSKVGVNLERFDELKPANMSVDEWTTVVILVFLDTYCANDRASWTLISKKGKDYLQQKGIRFVDFKETAPKVFF